MKLCKELAYKLHQLGWYQQYTDEEFYEKIAPTILEAWNWCITNSILKIQSMQGIDDGTGKPLYNHIILEDGTCFDKSMHMKDAYAAMEEAMLYSIDNHIVHDKQYLF